MKQSAVNSKIAVRLLCIAASVILILSFVFGAEAVMAADQYEINGVTLPLDEEGYKEGDLRGSGMCWEFARHVYYEIWGKFFYQGAGTDDDMLRDYPSGEARRITAENARLFIGAAPLGSVIRLQEVEDGSDASEGSRHSLILLDKTEEGCTVYHDWSGYSSITTFTWEEFEDQFRTSIDFGYFKYIKYPGAQALQYEYTAQEMEKELLITSRLYGIAELTETRRE